MLVGICFATAAVSSETAIECTENSDEIYRWWLTVLIVDVILGWIVITFFVCGCCVLCCCLVKLANGTEEEAQQLFVRYGEYLGRIPGVSEE
jgi:hypothetical protein